MVDSAGGTTRSKIQLLPTFLYVPVYAAADPVTTAPFAQVYCGPGAYGVSVKKNVCFPCPPLYTNRNGWHGLPCEVGVLAGISAASVGPPPTCEPLGQTLFQPLALPALLIMLAVQTGKSLPSTLTP